MAKIRLNGTVKWIGTGIAIAAIVWNAITLHFGVKENTAVLQNDIVHLTADVADIKTDVKAINTYLLERNKQ